MFWLMDSNSLR